MLHTIRQLVDNDSLWRAMLRGLNSEFFHQTVTSAQIENYISKSLKMDLSTIFNQYLRTTRLPALEYKKTRSGYEYRYTNVDSDFSMRLKVAVDGEERWIQPTERWQEIKCKQTGFVLNDNFYVQVIQN
jgi:aminopeptidase N